MIVAMIVLVIVEMFLTMIVVMILAIIVAMIVHNSGPLIFLNNSGPHIPLRIFFKVIRKSR